MTTTEQSRDIEIATEIRRQIGHGAMYMLGAQHVGAIKNGLAFKIRGSRKVSHIRIVLNAMDLYDVEYIKIRGTSYKVVATDNGLYFDMLHKSIETNTGLYTSL